MLTIKKLLVTIFTVSCAPFYWLAYAISKFFNVTDIEDITTPEEWCDDTKSLLKELWTKPDKIQLKADELESKEAPHPAIAQQRAKSYSRRIARKREIKTNIQRAIVWFVLIGVNVGVFAYAMKDFDIANVQRLFEIIGGAM